VTGVVIAALVFGLFLGMTIGRLMWRRRLPRWVASMLSRWRRGAEMAIRRESSKRSHAVLRGRITEQLAPLFLHFPFEASDARFIGSPIDFIVFDGYSDAVRGSARGLRSIVFIDVKTGSSTLTTVQRRIRDCVEAGNVWCYSPNVSSGPKR
jgi:predicted Holliday junction resolvase-like endonuclease